MSVFSGLMVDIASKQSVVVTEEAVTSVPVMATEPKWPVASGRRILKEASSKNICFYY